MFLHIRVFPSRLLPYTCDQRRFGTDCAPHARRRTDAARF